MGIIAAMHPLDQEPARDPFETVAIGCFASLCRDRLAEALVAFGGACPEVGIGVHEMGFAELLRAVADGRLALAIRPGGAVAGFAGGDLWAERAVIAMTPGHRLAGYREVTAAMLADEVLLVSRDRARGQLHRYLVERLFVGAGPATRIVADARRSQVLARVQGGEGIALLCESQVDAALAQLAVRRVADARALFRVRAYWLAGARPSTLQTLMGLLVDSRERTVR
jgi:DNA-binding transcriptional LysR family regulator